MFEHALIGAITFLNESKGEQKRDDRLGKGTSKYKDRSLA